MSYQKLPRMMAQKKAKPKDELTEGSCSDFREPPPKMVHHVNESGFPKGPGL